MADSYRGLILDFGGDPTTRMRLNGQVFEEPEGLAPGAHFRVLVGNPERVAVYSALEVGEVTEATQENWNPVVGGILGIDPATTAQLLISPFLDSLANWRRGTRRKHGVRANGVLSHAV
ncbi:hypothetical protein NX801_09715 [Streptomyces sp. LP05-1]|uniref:Uncharacterized protein n=1 Tax=Streptomyces pyxinae TaxID=2970734 RepID=A0ABT2CEV1_9ACTN|nr:hypothetical protein [Streptomyces sp. LP05-1]MCS0635939.1 hypothetical protein [Streptomyces sp. LP05-1]